MLSLFSLLKNVTSYLNSKVVPSKKSWFHIHSFKVVRYFVHFKWIKIKAFYSKMLVLHVLLKEEITLVMISCTGGKVSLHGTIMKIIFKRVGGMTEFNSYRISAAKEK